VLVSLRFGNGSVGTISYLANGDRAFSKERIEVFGGGGVAVLEDFRRLELARDGRKETIYSRWRQDKGHRDEWEAFVRAVQQQHEAPISFEELVCSTLATLRVDESVATGKRVAVDAASFLNEVRRTSSVNPSLNE
jgi:predicted dehydrogenase